MKIGIFGGTFNPLHNGHIIAAKEVLNHADIEEIWFMPCIINTLKDNGDYTVPELRLEMLQNALKAIEGFKVSDFEIKNNLKYTADTLSEVKKAFPEHQFYFILSSELAEELHKWRTPEKILEEVKLIIVPMPNMPNLSDEKVVESNPIILENSVRTDISSTKVRTYVKERKSISHLVPKEIEDFIKKKKMYL